MENTNKGIIRINADGTLERLPYPEKNNARELCKLIAKDCDLLQEVRPRRLYKLCGAELHVDPERPGVAVSMLVDEEYLLKEGIPELNKISSYLYEIDIHGHPIHGNTLLVGRKMTEGGDVDFCSLDSGVEEKIFENLTKMTGIMESVFGARQKEKKKSDKEERRHPCFGERILESPDEVTPEIMLEGVAYWTGKLLDTINGVMTSDVPMVIAAARILINACLETPGAREAADFITETTQGHIETKVNQREI